MPIRFTHNGRTTTIGESTDPQAREREQQWLNGQIPADILTRFRNVPQQLRERIQRQRILNNEVGEN